MPVAWMWMHGLSHCEKPVDERLTHGPGKRKRKPRKKGRR